MTTTDPKGYTLVEYAPGFEKGGYLFWPNGQTPISQEKAVEILISLGYIPTTPAYVAMAILNDIVPEQLPDAETIALVFQAPGFAVARQIYPLLQERDLTDFVEKTLAGGSLQDAVFVVKNKEK